MGRREPGAGEELTISRLLIANRGEIAVRVARTAREMGIETVGVHAESDAGRLPPPVHGPGGLARRRGRPVRPTSRSRGVLEAARASGADAVHPGYGFLSENAAFARAVERRGPRLGRPAAGGDRDAWATSSARAPRWRRPAFRSFRDRARGRSADAELGGRGEAPGISAPHQGLRRRRRQGDVARGAAGGPRRRRSRKAGASRRRPSATTRSTSSASSRAAATSSSRSSATARAASCISSSASAACSGGTRRSSRRRPARRSTPLCARAMGEAAVAAARAVGYVGAGTVEFLVDGSGRFYFLEMNTRLQVEHPITEETLGSTSSGRRSTWRDGRPLPEAWRDGSLSPRGHAIELRLYAEDPIEFLPRSGRLLVYREPVGPGRSRRRRRRRRKRRRRRVRPAARQARRPGGEPRRGDRARAAGARGVGRPRSRDEPAAARRRLRLRAVSHGPLHDGPRRAHRARGRGRSSRRRLDRRGPRRRPATGGRRAAVRPRRSARPLGRWRFLEGRSVKPVRLTHRGVTKEVRIDGSSAVLDGRSLRVEQPPAPAAVRPLLVEGRAHRVAAVRAGDRIWVWCDGRAYEFETARPGRDGGRGGDHHHGGLLSPMPGRVRRVLVAAGATRRTRPGPARARGHEDGACDPGAPGRRRAANRGLRGRSRRGGRRAGRAGLTAGRLADNRVMESWEESRDPAAAPARARHRLRGRARATACRTRRRPFPSRCAPSSSTDWPRRACRRSRSGRSCRRRRSRSSPTPRSSTGASTGVSGVRYPALVPNLRGARARAVGRGARDRGVHRGVRDLQPQEHQRRRRRVDRAVPARRRAREGGEDPRARVRLHGLRLPLRGRRRARGGARGRSTSSSISTSTRSPSATRSAWRPPPDVYDVIETLYESGVTRAVLALHFHDTRGTALANVYAALAVQRDDLRRFGRGARRLPVRSGRFRAISPPRTSSTCWRVSGLRRASHSPKVVEASRFLAERLGRRPPGRYLAAVWGESR